MCVYMCVRACVQEPVGTVLHTKYSKDYCAGLFRQEGTFSHSKKISVGGGWMSEETPLLAVFLSSLSA